MMTSHSRRERDVSDVHKLLTVERRWVHHLEAAAGRASSSHTRSVERLGPGQSMEVSDMRLVSCKVVALRMG